MAWPVTLRADIWKVKETCRDYPIMMMMMIQYLIDKRCSAEGSVYKGKGTTFQRQKHGEQILGKGLI